MTSSRLRIIVTGLIAQHPLLAGVTWDYLQYVLGLARLGHDVYYFEDSGQWPYTPDGGASGNEWIARDCAPNVDHLARVMARFGLADRWAYRFPTRPRWFGLLSIQHDDANPATQRERDFLRGPRDTREPDSPTVVPVLHVLRVDRRFGGKRHGRNPNG